MDLRPGQALNKIRIDRVFIGSCTNSIEDLRAAAAILTGRRSRVPGLVSPGSSAVKRQAEQEGLDRIFREAGLDIFASNAVKNGVLRLKSARKIPHGCCVPTNWSGTGL